MSHDLRNPLSTLRMGVEMLVHHEDLKPAGLKTVLRIQHTLEHMVRLVNDLLDFTQARLGNGLPVARAPMNLHDVVRQVVEELRMTSADRQIEVEAHGDGQGAWDPDRVGQATLNLVTNALKYSPPDGPVRVRTRGERDHVVLEVFNLGEPIAPVALPRLFEPLRRSSSHVDRSGRSVGLGLYIVKQIAAALGGTIDVASSAGTGTTFTLALPRGERPPRTDGAVG